ncbi:MAG: dihydroorotase [Candidatus Ranarchaeia archaeon]
MFSLQIVNGKIFTNNILYSGVLGIKEEKIVYIGKYQLESEKTINAKGKLILPGLIDLHVHFRDPGFPDKETFSSGSKSAVAGGVTTIGDMPNTKPPTDSKIAFLNKKENAMKTSYSNFGLHAGYTENKEELKNLILEGALSVKVYCDQIEQATKKIDKLFNQLSLEKWTIPITLHAEKKELIEQQTEGSEKYDLKWFNKSRHKNAEIQQIQEIIPLVKKYKQQTHFCHISTKESIALILEAKEKGLPITYEITPHHLELIQDKNEQNIPDGFFKVNPPLRKEEDVKVVKDTLLEGKVDYIASDHAPHTLSEKSQQDMREVPSGIVGTEIILPLLMSMVNKGNINLERFVNLTSINPARIMNISNNEIKTGNTANLVIIDQNHEWTIKGEELHGKTKFTPFEGKEVKGIASFTIVNGKIVFMEDKILNESRNPKFIRPIS